MRTLTCGLLLVATAAFAEPDRALYFGAHGARHYTITTPSAEAQRWFNQGLTLCYGFNHAEAIRSFEQAALADPDCAMAQWGIAYAWGPHINNPAMDDQANTAARAAADRAMALRKRATPAERALIEALDRRYAQPVPEDRAELDRAYADAMRKVWHSRRDDPDVGALFAESLMNLRPWDLWTADGKMQPGTDEIIATLETVLALEPRHPAANHFYIHTMEASPTPGKALPAADRLRDLVPWAGHLVHMPAHIDIRLGRYSAAATANQKAIAADREYVEKAGREGFYTIYRAHNYHFLAYAAMFDGRRDLALEAASAAVPESRFMGNNPSREILAVGLPLAEGELEYRRGRHDRAFALLREAVARDEALRYDEPWGWMQPVRHALGALLLEQDRVAEAEAVYREDLERHPDNGWALTGLAECLERSGRNDEVGKARAKVAEAWALADERPAVSCYCRRGEVAVLQD